MNTHDFRQLIRENYDTDWLLRLHNTLAVTHRYDDPGALWSRKHIAIIKAELIKRRAIPPVAKVPHPPYQLMPGAIGCWKVVDHHGAMRGVVRQTPHRWWECRLFDTQIKRTSIDPARALRAAERAEIELRK